MRGRQGGRGNLAICRQAGRGDKAVVLRLGRRCAKTCRHTFEGDWMGWNHEESASLHRKASCCEVRLGPMFMLAPQRGQRQVANWELAMLGSGRGWQAS
jgi:hypothetical protein